MHAQFWCWNDGKEKIVDMEPFKWLGQDKIKPAFNWVQLHNYLTEVFITTARTEKSFSFLHFQHLMQPCVVQYDQHQVSKNFSYKVNCLISHYSEGSMNNFTSPTRNKTRIQKLDSKWFQSFKLLPLDISVTEHMIITQKQKQC